MNSNIFGENKWTKKQLFSFYFFSIYFILFVFPFPFDLLTLFFEKTFVFFAKITGLNFFIKISVGFQSFFIWWDNLWQSLSLFFSKNIFNISDLLHVTKNGSSDKTYDFIKVFLMLNFSLLGSLVFYSYTKKIENQNRLLLIIVTGLRYFIAIMLIKYGFLKVFQNQFPTPLLTKYVQQLGDSSPKGLAWAFMGYSPAFNIFTGTIEIISALLLFFRPTRLLGALLSVAACTVVFVMNLCYDIPVKLFSAHLLLFSILLVILDYKQLLLFFVKEKSAQLNTDTFCFKNSKRRNLIIFVKWSIILSSIFFSAYSELIRHQEKRKNSFSTSSLYGIYNIKSKIINTDTIPLIYNDSKQWKQLVIFSSTNTSIKFLNDSSENYNFVIDTINKKIFSNSVNDANIKLQINYKLNKDTLILTYKENTDTIIQEFVRFDESRFLLNSRGFHWISEAPFYK